ncbi:phage holin family protein [Neisseriaceae bacterium ESL0693]|nr:phage holin family protein [Neisseriaceae bacterium ESL0693]
MSIGNFITEIRQLRHWFGYGAELLWIRVRLLRLDVVEQIRSVVLLIAATLGACMVFFLGIISLLFALNSLLSETARIWTFSGLAIGFLLVLLILIVCMIKLWRKQGRFMEETLEAMHDDFSYLHQRPLPREKHHD